MALFKNCLFDRKPSVVLPSTSSDWALIRAGIPQGSILDPLLFLMYINDIVTDIGSNIRLLALLMLWFLSVTCYVCLYMVFSNMVS